MDISVIVLTYNRQDKVKALINTLRKAYGPDLEIICVSDGCDPMPDVSSLCTLVWQADDGNRAASARNLAVEHATYDKIVFFDDDIEPHPLCLQAHSLCLEMYDISYGLLPEGNWNSELDSRTRFFFDESVLLWKFGFTGNMAIRRAAWEKVGPFDELYNGGHGFEDIDWGYRAKVLGLRMHLNRLAMALHPESHTSADTDNVGYQTNKKKFDEKWDGVLQDGFEVA